MIQETQPIVRESSDHRNRSVLFIHHYLPKVIKDLKIIEDLKIINDLRFIGSTLFFCQDLLIYGSIERSKWFGRLNPIARESIEHRNRPARLVYRSLKSIPKSSIFQEFSSVLVAYYDIIIASVADRNQKSRVS